MPATYPARAANVATHAWTKLYTESWAKLLMFMSTTIYARPYLMRPRQSTTIHIFVLPVSKLPSSVQAQIRIKLPRVLQLQLFSLQVANAASWQSGLHWPSHAHASRYWSSWNIWMCSFKIYDKWLVQASKHAHAHAQCSHASVGNAFFRAFRGGNFPP